MGAAAAAIGDYRERAEQALAAGCDYLPVCNDRAAAVALVERLPHTADAGTRRRERLRAACRPPRVALDGKLAESYRARAARALITQIARAD
jgi:beta-N-acetylhexosaminidase